MFLFKVFIELKLLVRYKIGGFVIGFFIFGFLIVMICIGWFCCMRNINIFYWVDDKEDEEEKFKIEIVCLVIGKFYGIKYIV